MYIFNLCCQNFPKSCPKLKHFLRKLKRNFQKNPQYSGKSTNLWCRKMSKRQPWIVIIFAYEFYLTSLVLSNILSLRILTRTSSRKIILTWKFWLRPLLIMSLAPSKYMGYTLLHLLCKSSMVPGLVGYPDVGGKSVRWYQRHGMRIMWEKHAINTKCGRINHCHLHLSFCLACRPLLLCSVARVGLLHKLEVHVCPFDLGDQSRCPRFRKKITPD